MMTEEEFIKKYCIWCDTIDYNDAQWGKKCDFFERCFTRWGNKENKH